MVLTIEVNVSGQVRELQLMAARFGDLLPVMGPFSAYMRKQIDEGFETQGNGTWPDRKDSTQNAYNRTKEGRIAKVEANKFRGLQNRLRAELKRTSRPSILRSRSKRRRVHLSKRPKPVLMRLGPTGRTHWKIRELRTLEKPLGHFGGKRRPLMLTMC